MKYIECKEPTEVEKYAAATIKDLRIKANWQRRDVGALLGISGSAVHSIECGKVKLTVRHIAFFAEVFEVPVKTFFR
jgi:transcriptional regulator with XRE-family HTH domain